MNTNGKKTEEVEWKVPKTRGEAWQPNMEIFIHYHCHCFEKFWNFPLKLPLWIAFSKPSGKTVSNFTENHLKFLGQQLFRVRPDGYLYKQLHWISKLTTWYMVIAR